MSVNAVGGELVLFQVPLKPGCAPGEPPAGIKPLYDALETVTVLPLCVTPPFQSCVMVCPLGKVNCKFQPLITVDPVLVMVIVAPKPVFH